MHRSTVSFTELGSDFVSTGKASTDGIFMLRAAGYEMISFAVPYTCMDNTALITTTFTVINKCLTFS